MYNYYNKTSQEVFELVFDAKKFEVVNQGSANIYTMHLNGVHTCLVVGILSNEPGVKTTKNAVV